MDLIVIMKLTLVAHLPKQGSRQGANARPSTTRCQVDRTNPSASSKPKLNTKESGGGVPADKGTASGNVTDQDHQVPPNRGKHQAVPYHKRYATLRLPIVNLTTATCLLLTK